MNRTIRRAAKLIAAPAVALTLLAPVLAAAPASAATTDAYTFTNPNGTLNATGTGDGAQISVTPDGTNYTNWRLIKLDDPGAFEIANTSSGKCVYSTQPAVQQSCGKDGEQWHFRPVDGKPNAFGIVRRDDSSGTEYCMDNRGGLHLWGVLAQPNICDGSAGQEWTVPASKAAEAKQLALDYYADLCSKKTATCSWTQKSEGQPEVLPRQPASSVWYNDTGATMKQVFTTIYHSGWAQSYSVGLSSSVGVSVPVQSMITSQLTATQTYTSDETTVNGIAIDVPSKNYGWVDFAAVGKKVTGTWTFDTDNQPWSADATVTVPVINSTAGSTMYIARTSLTTPGSDGTSGADVKPQTFATTTTQTLDMPAGTHLAAYKGGIRATDADGSTITTVMPTTIKDADGTTHTVDLSVSGNTITQTIEGTNGNTVTGVMAPPAFSIGDNSSGATAASQSAKTAQKTALALRPALSDNNKKNLSCIEQKMGEGAVTGLLAAAAGQPEGPVFGVFGGLIIGLAECK